MDYHCTGCRYEGGDFESRVGSDIHTDGLPIDQECPETPWAECPKCAHLSAVL